MIKYDKLRSVDCQITYVFLVKKEHMEGSMFNYVLLELLIITILAEPTMNVRSICSRLGLTLFLFHLAGFQSLGSMKIMKRRNLFLRIFSWKPANGPILNDLVTLPLPNWYTLWSTSSWL